MKAEYICSGENVTISDELRILERNVRIHRVYAEAFKVHFIRLWNRSLTSDECEVIDGAQLCSSFMGLEMMDLTLAHAKDESKANEVFEAMKDSVKLNRNELLAAFEKMASKLSFDVASAPNANLLLLEEALHAHATRRNAQNGCKG